MYSVLAWLLHPIDRFLCFSTLMAIQGYRRFVSPYKGYRCAYSVLSHQGPSCSDMAVKILENHSFLDSLIMIRQQFKRCKNTYMECHQEYVEAATQVVNDLSPVLVDDVICCRPCG